MRNRKFWTSDVTETRRGKPQRGNPQREEPRVETISPDAIYTRPEAMKYLRLKPATFSKLTNGKLNGVPPLMAIRVGRLQRFRGATLIQWILDAEAMQCNAAH